MALAYAWRRRGRGSSRQRTQAACMQASRDRGRGRAARRTHGGFEVEAALAKGLRRPDREDASRAALRRRLRVQRAVVDRVQAIAHLALSPSTQLPPLARHSQVSVINISTASAKCSRSVCMGLLLVAERFEFMPCHQHCALPLAHTSFSCCRLAVVPSHGPSRSRSASTERKIASREREIAFEIDLRFET